jgi:hypothetical protein
MSFSRFRIFISWSGITHATIVVICNLIECHSHHYYQIGGNFHHAHLSAVDGLVFFFIKTPIVFLAMYCVCTHLQTCGVDSLNGLQQFTCIFHGFNHALMSRKISHFHPCVYNQSSYNLFNTCKFFLYEFFC